MITRVEVSGFKSLQSFALDLGPFTALIGPNGAGKSNVLDALGLLSRIASGDLATALSGGRGRIREQLASMDEQTLLKGFGQLGKIEIAAEMLLPPQATGRDTASAGRLLFPKVRYEATIELQSVNPALDRVVLLREKVIAWPSPDAAMSRSTDAATPASDSEGELLFSFDRGRLSVTDPAALGKPPGESHVQYVVQRAHLVEGEQLAASPHLRAVADELKRIRLVHLEPRLLREPSDRAAPRMTTDGAHLAKELAELSDAFPDRMARVRARLAALVPGARALEILARDEALLVELELTDGRRFTSRVLSDGTLRIIGLLTLLESRGGLLAIEEPENGVHPARTRGLTETLRDAAQASNDEAPSPNGGAPGRGDEAHGPPQIVITSHSPAVLSALMDHPEDISCIDMVRRGLGPRITRARRIAKGDEIDRGETTVSRSEIERLLATAALSDPEASGP